MSSTPREVLAEIIARHGETLLEFPIRCEGLLKDYCDGFPREVAVLVNCLRAGFVNQLRRQSGPSMKLICARLALKLEQNLSIPGDFAKWAVETWAIALGLMTSEPTTSRVKATEAASTVAAQIAWPMPENASPRETPEMPPPSVQASQPEAPTTHERAVTFLAREPDPRWLAPDWDAPTEQVVVYPDDSGQRPNLREAVRDVAANGCLLLKPGLYRETLVIKKNLQIRAESGPVIIESTSSSAVVLDSACLFLRGLTLKGMAGKDPRTLAAVEVKSGHLAMADCEVTSEVSTVMEVKGAQSEVFLRRCHLHDGKAGGILFQDEAAGYLEECHLYRNKLSHVVIGKGCSPTLLSCKISHGLMAGIYVSEGGEGLIENCDIWSNAVGGVQCRRGGNPRVRHCRISMNERYGILVTEQGEGFFEHCRIFDQGRAGVSIGQHGTPRFSSCQIFDNRGEGVEFSEHAKGELLECEIFSNEGANVVVKQNSAPRLHRCVIHDGQREGARIESASESLFEDCEFFGNELGGALVQNARPIFQRCVFHHGDASGIVVSHAAEGRFIDCEVTHHEAAAIRVGDRAAPHFERCHVRNNLGAGVQVEEAATPILHACVIAQNGGIGFLCARNGAPRMTEGEIGENGGGGLVVSSQGRGRWENVRFAANRGDTVLVSEGGRPALRLCRIEDAEGAALHFGSHSQGVVEETVIERSGGSGIEIEAGANPSLRNVRVHLGKSVGIRVHALGGGSADGCEAIGNAGGDWEIADGARFTRSG